MKVKGRGRRKATVIEEACALISWLSVTRTTMMHLGDLSTAPLALTGKLGCRGWGSPTPALQGCPSLPLPECSTAFLASGSPFVSGRWVTPQTRWCRCSSLGKMSRTSRRWLSLGHGHSHAGASPWALQSTLPKDLDISNQNTCWAGWGTRF